MTTMTAPPLRRSQLLLAPLGLVMWGVVGTGIYLENETVIGIGAGMMITSILVRLGLMIRRSAADRAERHRIWMQGRPATARVLSVSTNGSFNDHPRVTFELEVEGPAPYRATVEQVVSRLAVPRIQPGATIDLRVDPADRAKLVLDESLIPYGYRA